MGVILRTAGVHVKHDIALKGEERREEERRGEERRGEEGHGDIQRCQGMEGG